MRSTASNPKPTNHFLYNNKLRTVGHAKYLGVLLDSKLNFNKHNNICGKANSVLTLLKHNSYHCNSQVRSQAYFLYLQPIMEYASTVWAHILEITLKSSKVFSDGLQGLWYLIMIFQVASLVFWIRLSGIV